MLCRAILVLSVIAGMALPTSAQVRVREFRDPGYRLLGAYRGLAGEYADYAGHGVISLGDTFPNKKQFWAGMKTEHDSGKASDYSILGVYLGIGPGPRLDEGLTMDKIKQRLDAWLKTEPGIPTYPELIPAITIAEENVPTNSKLLDQTTRYVRETYGIPVFQWWSDPIPPSPGLAADGWVWDSYFWEYPRFRKHLMKFVSLGKPLNCLVWATDPAWPNYAAGRFGNTNDLINNVDDQFRVCMEYNVPVVLFAVSGPPGSVDMWMGSDTPDMVALRNWIKVKRAQMHSFKPGDLPLSSANYSARGRSVPVGGDADAPSVYREDFSGFGWIEDANLTGFLDMRLTSEPQERPGYLLAKSSAKRPVEATLTYRFESHFPLKNVKVTLAGAAPPAARSKNTIALSTDEKTWSIRREQSGNAEIKQTDVNADESFLKGSCVFYVKVKMANDARKDGVPANRLDWLKVECIHDAPANAVASLSADQYGGLYYDDDFSTSRWEHLGSVDVNGKGGYREGEFWVGSRAGSGSSVHLVQSVQSPGEMKGLTVSASAYANARSLGGGVELGVGPRGGPVRWSMTAGDQEDWLDLSIPVAQLAGLRDFDVHITLKSTSGVDMGDTAPATVTALKIRAMQ